MFSETKTLQKTCEKKMLGKVGFSFGRQPTKTTWLRFLRKTYRSFSQDAETNRPDSIFMQTIRSQIKDMQQNGTYKRERIIVSPQSAEIDVFNPATNKKERVLNFWFVNNYTTRDKLIQFTYSANNYLGLADNRSIIEASKKAMDTHGHGLSSVRFICGTQEIHKELESKIAQFHGKEDSILYAR
jgi:glycine C-acetyltransferase